MDIWDWGGGSHFKQEGQEAGSLLWATRSLYGSIVISWLFSRPGGCLAQEPQDYISAFCKLCGSAGLLCQWPLACTRKECEAARMRISISKCGAIVLCQKMADCSLCVGVETGYWPKPCSHEWQEDGDGHEVWVGICGNAGTVSNHCVEERPEPQSGALDLPVCLSHLPIFIRPKGQGHGHK